MSQNHQTCIDRVWGNLDDLDNAHNIWLKDLQQRRQTRHLSLVNPIHFIPSISSKMLHASSCETIGLLDHHIFRTIKSLFVFPPSLPYNRGKMETDPFQQCIQTDGRQQQVGSEVVQKSYEIPESQSPTISPDRKRKRLAATFDCSLNWHNWVLNIEVFRFE